MPFYAVAVGRIPGIYCSWQECCNQVHKYSSAKFKKFNSKEDAEKFILLHKQSTNSDNRSKKKLINLNNQTENLTKETLANQKLKSVLPISSLIRPNSLESVIYEKSIKKTQQEVNSRLSRRCLSNQVNETIVLSDDEQINSPAKKTEEKEDSVILIDEDSNPPQVLNSKKKNNHSNKANRATKSSPKKAATTSKSIELGDFIPLNKTLEPAVNDENRSKNESKNMQNTQKTRERKGHVVVYTDGACTNNGRINAKAGIGVWWGESDSRNISEPIDGRATNNRAEIWAAIRAINQAADEGYDSITVCSDSDFLIKSAKYWIFDWKKKNWHLSNGKKVINKDDFLKLIQAMERIKVVWNKVKSHIGILGNEEADRLANEAIGVKKKKN